MPPLIVRTTASNGFGGHHIAYTDNVNSLLVNPAAMVRVRQGNFFTLELALFSPEFTADAFETMSTMVGGTEDAGLDINAIFDLLEALSKNNMGLGLEIRDIPHLSFAYVANGLGLGLWTNTFMNINIMPVTAFMEINVYADMIFPIGFAFTILDIGSSKHTFDAGLTIKPFARFMMHGSIGMFNIAMDMDAFIDSVNRPVIAGGGLDAGLLYRWDKGLSIGFTFNDIFSYGHVMTDFSGNDGPPSYYVPFNMNLGLAFDFRLDRFWSGAPAFFRNTGIVAAFDWRNIENIFNQEDPLSKNAVLDLGFGVQLYFMDIFYFRIGVSEMLPAAGIGLHFGIFEIDFAYYGREFGYEPGQLSAAVMEFSIAIRPETKKGNWPWARRPLFSIR